MIPRIAEHECFHCKIAAETKFMFAERVRLCETCMDSPTIVLRAIKFGNTLTAIELERKRKVQLMHSYYIAPLRVQNSPNGQKILDDIVASRIRIAHLEKQLSLI